MSIDIRITQKGLLKKTLPLHVITGSDLCYGTSDGMKLKENDLSSDEIILYHSNHISRGFSIVPNEGREADVKYVLSNSLGFGGHNGTLIMKKYED